MTSPEPDTAEARKRKLTGRIIVVAFGLLLLVYVVVTFIR
jgi:hypothetical protein